MADIAMCMNEFCTLKDSCYRYKAQPHDIWQSYGDFKQVRGECDHYWKDTRTEREIQNKQNTLG